MNRVVLSLGSSLGDKKKTLQLAIDELQEFSDVTAISSMYETEPWGFDDENRFINMAVEIETEITAFDLLEKIHVIEKKYGRIRTGKGYSARTLDIDIIFYNDLILNTEKLIIPHKHAHKRKFVLYPVAEIAPDFIHPILSKSVEFLAKNVEDNTQIKKLDIVNKEIIKVF